MDQLLLRQLQFSSSGAAGGVFLGSPQSEESMVDNNGGGDATSSGDNMDSGGGGNDDDDGPPMAVVGLLVLLALLAGVALLALTTWSVSYIFDHYCCCLPWFHSLDFAVAFDHSAMARRARLYGLTLTERRRILQEYIFGEVISFSSSSSSSSSQQNTNDAVEGGTVEAGNGSHEKQVQLDSSLSFASSKKNSLETTVVATAENSGDVLANPDTTTCEDVDEQQNNEEQEPECNKDDADHERLCCICLAEYKIGDRLLRGTQCNHLFHWRCSMDWLMVPHDHCPYCRQNLVTATAFRQAAIHCLGAKRVQEMGSGMMEMTTTTTTRTSTTNATNTAVPTADTDTASTNTTTSRPNNQSIGENPTPTNV